MIDSICDFTNSEKRDVLRRHDLLKKLSPSEAAEKLGVSLPLLNVFLKNRADIESNVLTDDYVDEQENNFAFPQWLAGFAVALLLTQAGFMGGWASPTLAKLMSPDSPIPLTPQQASWVASFLNSGGLIGAILGPIFASVMGSKSTISVTLWPIALGWLLIFLAKSAMWLYGARVFLGLGLGMTCSVFPLYVGEVSMPEIRGALISLATVGAPIGEVVASICGSYLGISMAASIYLSLTLLLMFLFFWMPNSPHHLVKTGKLKKARKAIDWYRAGLGVDKELEAVDKFVTGSGAKSFRDTLRRFRNPAIRRAIVQIIILFASMQFCGLASILSYMENILKSAKFTLIKPSLVVIYVNVCGMVAAVISIALIDRCGRKFLLVVSSAGVTISMMSLSTHFFLLDGNVDVMGFEWVPMASMFLFIVFFFAGLFPVPNVILSETFPADMRSAAAIIVSVAGAVTSFMSAKSYQPLVEFMGEKFVFLAYAIFACFIIPYTLIAVPETKGKSLQQIQDELIKK